MESVVALTPVDPFPVSTTRQKELERIAAHIEQADECGRDAEQYADHVVRQTPSSDACVLAIDDYAWFANLGGVLGVEYYTSRAFLRARKGDIVAGTFDPIPGYFEYLDRLGVGAPLYVQVRAVEDAPLSAMFTHLGRDERAQRQICEYAEGRPIIIHPFTGVRAAWESARILSGVCSVPVGVLAPLPAIFEIANRKDLFLPAAERVIGSSCVMTYRIVRTADEIASAVAEFARSFPAVGINLSDSASGMGLDVVSSDDAGSAGMDELRSRAHAWAKKKGWNESSGSPVVIAGWEPNVTASPSAQVWIPPKGEGTPIVEGIFEQLFVTPGNSTVFTGSVRSTLPKEINEEFSRMASEIAFAFQQLGYVGRCSFDAIVCKNTIKFVECNGRWGGTSTPMMLMNRLFGDYRTQPYQSVDFVSPMLKGVSFDIFVDRMADVLYTPDNGGGWAVLYNVGCLQPTGKLDVITIGETLEEAQGRQAVFRKLVEERFE